MSTHDEIKTAYESYVAEQEAFETKGVKAAAARARKALGNLGKLSKTRRKEIQEKKTLCNLELVAWHPSSNQTYPILINNC